MELVEPLQVGDRVRVLRKADGLAKGTQGTVVRKLPNTDCYDVRFENYPWLRLVYRGDLTVIEQMKEGATNEERTQPAASISTDKARHCTLQLDETE
jgi:hypothetical protein